MNLTIILDDSAVYVDGQALSQLDLSTCGIPSDVHALQWKSNLGWIEFKDNLDFTKSANEIINSLPDWANNCVNAYNAKVAELQAEAEAAKAKAAANQPISKGTQVI
jgi:hypothetical protein